MSVQRVGQKVRREEDLRLLTGRGRYVEDVPAQGAARGYVLRSPHAHARIRSIDTRQASGAPGVLTVLTGAELKARGLGTLRPGVPRRRRDGTAAFVCPQPLLAQDRVRYVGTRRVRRRRNLAQARMPPSNRGEYEPLPAVVFGRGGARAGRPQCGRQPGQRGLHPRGRQQAQPRRFARAAHVVHHRVVVNRVSASSMEPRSCLAHYDLTRSAIRSAARYSRYTRQGPRSPGRYLPVPHHQIRVGATMGGGFGMKAAATRNTAGAGPPAVGCPVRRVAERSEGL